MFSPYSSSKLRENIWQIHEKPSPEAPGVQMYLVEGADQAALIDAGFGVTDTLRSYVESLTSKPIIVLVGHGHPDHAGAAALFDTVYMSSRDEDIIDESLSYEKRMGDVFGRGTSDEEYKAWCEKHIVMTDHLKYQNMDEGDVFDLGGIKLNVIAIPGHTNGSVSFVCHEERIAFVSDCFCFGTALAENVPDKGEGVRLYRDGLLRFLAAIDDDYEIYWGHREAPMNHSIPRDMATACQEVLDGKTENDTEGKKAPPPDEQGKHPGAPGDPGGPGARKKRLLMSHTVGSATLSYEPKKL